MKLAIFGGDGYLGSQLAFYFKAKGVLVDCYDLPTCDVLDDGFWNGFEPADYSSVLFFSGLTGTEASFRNVERFLLVNELGLVKLLRRLSCLGRDAPRVVFPSSRLVYKGSSEALSEDAEKETKTPYAVNKMACEGFLHAYNCRFGIPYSVVRICVPFGSLVEANYSYGTIGFFEEQAKQGKNIRLFGGGVLRRTFSHVRDICAAIERIMEADQDGVFNVGGVDRSLREMAEAIAQRNNVKVESAPWPDEALAIETGSTVFDASKLDGLG